VPSIYPKTVPKKPSNSTSLLFEVLLASSGSILNEQEWLAKEEEE